MRNKGRYQIVDRNDMPTMHNSNNINELKERAKYLAKILGCILKIKDKNGTVIFETKLSSGNDPREKC